MADITSPGESLTLKYYNDNAEQFVAKTVDANMEEIRSRFLAHLPAGARVLEFGCGSGRDAKAFHDLGYEVTAIDGAEELCRIASDFAGIPVKCQDFRDYSPGEGEVYEGIWACASLLHLKKSEMLPVLEQLNAALGPGGILYVSFKYGDFEGERNGRQFTDFTVKSFGEFIKDMPSLQIIEYWETGDVRPGREDEKWANMILEKKHIPNSRK